MTIAAEAAAARLSQARRSGMTIEPFSDVDPSVDATWGYSVQDLDRQNRRANSENVIGAKLGLTTLAKQRRIGVDTPVVGFLTDAMMVEADRVSVELERWVQPRIEPEIAFVTARDISGPITRAEAAALVDFVTVGAEIIDSRFNDYRFGLADVISDNTSAAGLIVGPRHRLADIDDLSAVQCVVEVNGVDVREALGSAVLGDPLLSLVVLARHLADRGETLSAGSVVLAGALTDSVPLNTDCRYALRVESLGAVYVAL
ncbi:2-keto-4-pentenoate hydratase [Rhodococcus sp. 06-1460-1B]|uniref:2-keto-4-pentenoate hydratase n=1 Tax=Rhodococcus sp. 06-1460-1B TaxID=2022501 RepID=UPI000B9A742F|nr:fumarylacetoacetate hydrolase family protein [Rhodococcus sp. 06-1460-1B]OZD65488.1 hypothetical protein CH268_04300 [Rhodococcus sp. 06-1460-1B]